MERGEMILIWPFYFNLDLCDMDTILEQYLGKCTFFLARYYLQRNIAHTIMNREADNLSCADHYIVL